MIALSDVQSHCDRILDAVEQAVVGKREALELVLLGMLADGHVLIEDFPGLAKTLLARSFAAVTDLRFSRIQFTPDLMPADVTGSSIYNQRTSEFDFRPGPVFANLLLGDEINRAPPKTQAALLEAMQERQVTLEGETRQLERPFLVLATQNPIEYEGTYPLPEAQLDRFLLRIGVGYPAREHEWEMLERRRERRVDEVELTPVVDRETVLALQRAIEEVHVAESIGLYMVDVVAATRASTRVQVGASPRGSLALLKLSRGLAALARPRLRHARGREERRRARARPPPHSEPRAVGAADTRRGCRAGVSGRRADAQGRGRRSRLAVTRAATAKLAGYASLAALGLFAGIAFGRAELVVLATPFVLVLAIGLVFGSEPALEVEFESDAARTLEGDEVPLHIRLDAGTRIERLELSLALPRDAVAVGDTSFGLTLGEGEQRELTTSLRFPRWGVYRLGRLGLAAFDRLGLFVFERELPASRLLRVYPREERLREIVRPRDTQAYVGNLVARQKGEGIEFADLRLYQPGDRVRRVNWKATARRGALVVNEEHPERNAAAVLLLDSFAEARLGAAGTLDQAVRATAALAGAYLRRRDQVGLLSFGGSLNWLEPALGTVQLYRIVEALLDTEVVLSYVWRDIRVIPTHALPPKALVLCLTPLLDERMVNALVDVRGRGADVAAVEIAPESFIQVREGEQAQLAFRIWKLRRAAVRSNFRRLGVPVVQWRWGDPLEPVLEEVSSFRRFARAMRA